MGQLDPTAFTLLDELRNDLANSELENKHLSQNMAQQREEIERLKGVHGLSLETKKALRRIHYEDLNAISLARKKIVELEEEVNGARDVVERAQSILAKNNNLETELGMLRARLKTFEKTDPPVDPKEIVLLDGIKDDDSPARPKQKKELFRVITEMQRLLEAAYRVIGSSVTKAEAAEQMVIQLKEEAAPFQASAQGAGWVFGFLNERPSGASLSCHTSGGGPRRFWIMEWPNNARTSRTSCSADTLAGLNTRAHQALLDDMPDPTIPNEQGDSEVALLTPTRLADA